MCLISHAVKSCFLKEFSNTTCHFRVDRSDDYSTNRILKCDALTIDLIIALHGSPRKIILFPKGGNSNEIFGNEQSAQISLFQGALLRKNISSSCYNLLIIINDMKNQLFK